MELIDLQALMANCPRARTSRDSCQESAGENVGGEGFLPDRRLLFVVAVMASFVAAVAIVLVVRLGAMQ